MREEFVSFGQARLLKECGFDINQWRGENYVEKIPGTEKEEWDDEECQWVTTCDIKLYPKLRLDQAQKWLREVVALHITIEPVMGGMWTYEVVDLRMKQDISGEWYSLRVEERDGYPSLESYKSALSTGIDAALELIRKNKYNE